MTETLADETDIELACAALAGVPEGDTASLAAWRQKRDDNERRWQELRAAYMKGVAAGREAVWRELAQEFNL